MKTKMVAIVFVLMAMISSFSYAVNGNGFGQGDSTQNTVAVSNAFGSIVHGDMGQKKAEEALKSIQSLQQELDQRIREHREYEKELTAIKNTVAQATQKIELFKNVVFQHARSEEACRRLRNDYERKRIDTDFSRQLVQQCFRRLKITENSLKIFRKEAHDLLDEINRLRQNSVIISQYMPTLEQQITEIRSMIDYVKLRVDADRAGGAQ